MEDLTFLEQLGADYDDDYGILKAVDPHGHVSHISDRINPFRLLDNCPLLYHAFEYGHQSRLQASIEAPSRAAAISLLRYCYTGSYLPPGSAYAPVLLLLHAEVYRMAEDYDVPELQLLAHGNFSIQVDCACSLPMPPQDLLETIRYLYADFATPQGRRQHGLFHSLLNYCIAVFQYHKLGESDEFIEVVRQIPEFWQDLCHTNMERNFQDECAFDIVRLAIDIEQPQTSIRPTMLASRDLPDEMLYDRPDTPRPSTPNLALTIRNACKGDYDSDEDLDKATTQASSSALGQSTLVYRPKTSVMATGFDTDSSSEDEGFSMVHHPRAVRVANDTSDDLAPSPEYHASALRVVNATEDDLVSSPEIQPMVLQVVNAADDDLMSSPEIIPSTPFDVLAATGSNYSDDDDWTML